LDGLKLDWFKIRNAADEDTAEVLIYEAIGGWFGVPADEFVRELNGITAQNIHVRINSPGGSVFDSIAIYNALVKNSAKVTVYVDSLAASGASVIAMAGDDIVMMVGSQMMIHDASGIEMGDARMMREMADFLDKQSDNIASIYAAKIDGDPAEMRALMLAETWMMAQEAVDLGLADRVYTKEMDKPADPEEDDDESSEDGAEEETDTEEVESEEDIEDLMSRPHALAAMNFKYAGRRKAPAPPTNSVVTDSDLDSFIAGMQKILGSK
jgi:ATP-dependent protease ClpP protease subunit